MFLSLDAIRVDDLMFHLVKFKVSLSAEIVVITVSLDETISYSFLKSILPIINCKPCQI